MKKVKMLKLFCLYFAQTVVAGSRKAPPSLPMQVKPLGRPVTLGAMYDARTDMFFEDISFWSPERIKNETEYDDKQQDVRTDVNIKKTLKERLDLLNVNAALKLSVMSGLIEVSGSAGFLSDEVSKSNEVNVNLNYHTTKYKEYIPNSTPLSHAKFCKNPIFTHAVTAVTYGMDANFVFKKIVKDSSKKQEIAGSLQVLIKKIPGITIEGDASIQMDEKELLYIQDTSLKMYGDFSPTEPLPTNFEEAVSFYKTLPTLSGTRENKYIGAAPLSVKITPIHMICTDEDRLLNDISTSAIENVGKMIDELQLLDMRVGELLSRTPAILFSPIQRNLNIYRTALSAYTSEVKSKLKELLPKIRGGDGEKYEIDLMTLTRDWEASQFVVSKSGMYLDDRTREIGTVEKLLEMYPSAGVSNIIVVDYASANDNGFRLKKDALVVGELNILSLPKVTNDFLAGNPVYGNHWYENDNTVSEIGFNLKRLGQFALANKEVEERGYMIELLPEDSTPLRVKATKSSRRGPKVFDYYSVQNEAPQVTTGTVGSTYIELLIIRPILSIDVSGCRVVYTKVGGLKQEKIFSFSKQGQETFKLDRLLPFSTYELTMEYITVMGVSPSTSFTVEGSNAITTTPTSPPQNIKIQKRRFNSLGLTWEKPSTIAPGINEKDISYKISVTGPGHMSEHTIKELQHSVNSLVDASSFNVTVTALIRVKGIEYLSGPALMKTSTAPLPLVIARDTSVPVTKYSVGVKWTKPSRLPVGATINSYTVQYTIQGSSLTPGELTVGGSATRAEIKDLKMGETYVIKVKMELGEWGETEYSFSGLVVRTLESKTDLENVKSTLKNEFKVANSNLESKISRDISFTKRLLENRIASNKREIDATKVKTFKSSICGWQDVWKSPGTIKYDKVHKEVEEVGSNLNAGTGVYSAGVDGIYEISASGYVRMDPGEEVRVDLDGMAAYGEENHYFIGGWSKNIRISEGTAGTRHVKLKAGQKISLKFVGSSAEFVRFLFCVTLYEAL